MKREELLNAMIKHHQGSSKIFQKDIAIDNAIFWRVQKIKFLAEKGYGGFSKDVESLKRQIKSYELEKAFLEWKA